MVGIKPDVDNDKLRFAKYKGIFYQLCKSARENYESAKTNLNARSYEEIIAELTSKITDETPLEFKTTTGM
jgi:ATP-dependent exoDNAse (exonuclease V) beta subunit